MVKVGTISVDLVAHTGKLLKPLKQAEAGVSSMIGKFAKFGGIGAAIAAPVAGLLSMNAAINKVKSSFAELDTAGKAADRLGVTTETLTGLQHAANLAGVSAEQLQSSLEFMLKKGFAVDQLGRMADEMVAISDPMQRMQWIIERFGRSGAGMINVLGAGSKGLRDMADDAQRLGLTFSRLDAAKVEAANDAFARIGLAIKGVSNSLAIELAPWVEWLSNKATALFTDYGAGAKFMASANELVARSFDAILSSVDFFIDGLATIKYIGQLGIDALLAGFYELNAIMRETAAFLRDLSPVDVWKDVDFGAAAARKYADSMADALTIDIDDATREWRKTMDRQPMTGKLRELIDGFSAAVPQTKVPRPDLTSIEDAMADLADQVKGVDVATKGTTQRGSAGAFEFGSVAAMSAISATQRPVEQQQLDVLKMVCQAVDDVAKNTRNGVFLRHANL